MKIKTSKTDDVFRIDRRVSPGQLAACLCIIVLSILSEPATGQKAPSSQPSLAEPAAGEIQPLIEQLGAPNFPDRVVAQTRLANMGTAALPALDKAAASDPDPEIRSRAAAVGEQIKTRDALDATLITLHEKEADQQKVLDIIGKQAHVNLQGSGATVTLDADQKPYWEVISDLCTQLNVCPAIYQDGTIRLVKSSNNWVTQSPHQIAGPYWVSVAGFDLRKTVNLFGATLTDQQFSVRLRVIPEPKLPVKRIFNFAVAEARDDAGNSLLPLIHHEIAMSSPQQGGMYALESHLTYPNRAGTRVSVLAGEFSVLLATQTHRYQVSDVLGKAVASNEIKDCPVQVTLTTPSPGLFRVNLVGNRKNLGDSQWSMSVLNLLDSKNRPLVRVDEVSSTAAPRSGTRGETFFLNESFALNRGNAKPGSGEDAHPQLSLIWEVPISFKTITVPVTFKDLPMP